MVNAPRVFLTRLQFVRIVAVALLAGLAGVSGVALQDPPDADDPLALQPDQAYFSQFPWEHADVINGNLLFSFTDLALPGDAGMDLRLVRSYNHQDEEQKWTFGLAGVPIFIDTENQPATFDPVLVSADGGRQVARPAGGSTFLTQDFSRYDSATQTLEMPNGWVATYHTASPHDLMLQQVTDPFGNTITPTWEPDSFRPQRLKEVVQTVSGASRRVEFTYTAQSGRMPSRMRLIDGNGPGAHRDWNYGYGPTIQPETLVTMLSQATPPAGEPWTFAYTLGSGPEGTDTVVVTTPNGGTVSYGLPRSFHGTAEFGYRARIATRTTGGRAIPAGTWLFEWGKNPGRVTLPDGRELTFVHEFTGGGFGRRWILTNKTLSGNGSTASITREYEDLPVPTTTPRTVKIVTKDTIDQDGRSHVTDYEYSGNNNGDYHRPNRIVAYAGGRVREIDRSYQHLSSPYLLGLMTSETITVGSESATSSFSFGGDGFLTQETGAGATTIFTPTAQGNRASAKDARDNTTSFSYQWGVVQNIQTPKYLIERSIRLDGAVTSETRNGATTSYQYDALGRPTQVAPPGVNATVTDYLSDKVVTTRGNSAVETFIDGFGRPTKTVSAENVCVETSYNADGRKAFQSDPSNGCGGGGDAFEFDFLGRVKKVIHADGSFITRNYLTGADAGKVDITDENGHTTRQTWEAFGAPGDAVLTGLRDADFNQWVYSYNHLNSLTRVVAPGGSERVWQYNSVSNRLENETHPESGTTLYDYDAVGNLTFKRNAKGQEFTYGYDEVNRLMAIDGPDTTSTVRFDYDEADNRIKVENDVDVRFFYDAANRMYKREVTINTHTFRTDFEYDALDNLWQIEYPSGRKVNYTYDLDGRPLSAKDGDTGATFADGVAYHASGIVSGMAFGNQLQETVSEYADTRRPRRIQSGPLDIEYEYDNAGNVVSVSDGRGSAFSSTFGYDVLDRLTTVDGYGRKTFEYDALGNRTKKTIPLVGQVDYTYDPSTKRLSSTSSSVPGEGGGYDYDNNGNLTQELSGATYQYTPFNMVSKATVGGATTFYTYDGDGQRVRKSGATGVRYFVPGLAGQLLAEHEEAGGQTKVVREHIYLGSRLVASVGRDVEPPPGLTVTVTSPVASEEYLSEDDITIQASVANAASPIARMEFFEAGVMLGSDTTAPYEWVWTAVPEGQYSVLARAVLQNGVAAPSVAVPVTVIPVGRVTGVTASPVSPGVGQPVTVTATGNSNPCGAIGIDYGAGAGEVVVPREGPLPHVFTPAHVYTSAGTYVVQVAGHGNCRNTVQVTVVVGTNQAPAVTLTAPANGAFYTPQATILLAATASDGDGTIASVKFYAGSTLLGQDTTSPYTWSWSTPSVGTHTLTAKAIDNLGKSATSAPSVITVAAAPPPRPILELNGDGNADAFTYNPASGLWAREVTQANGTFVATTGTWVTDWTIVAAKFNGDLRSDFFQFNTTSGQWNKKLHTDASGFTTQASGTWWPGWQRFVTDLDGDGLSDLFLYDPATGQWSQALSTPTGFDYYHGVWAANWEVIPMALNGDVLGDFFLINRTSGQWVWAMGAAGGGFTYPMSGTWYPSWGFYPGDFNGDTLSDLLLYHSPTGNYSIALNNGAGFTPMGGTWGTGWMPRVADLDADGDDDVFLYNSTSGSWTALISDGTGTFSIAIGSGWAAGWTEVIPTDFNADGRADFLLHKPATGAWVQKRSLSLGSFATTSGAWASNLTVVAVQAMPRAANALPFVSLTSPAAGATYTTPATVHLAASASDSGGSIASVKFYANGGLLHTATTAPYVYTWSPLVAGSYSLTAVVTDNLGGTRTSAAVPITIQPSAPSTFMEALPMVAIEESPGGGPDVFALTDGPTAVADHEFTSPSVPPAPVTLTLDLTGTGTGTVTSTPAGLAVCSGPAQTCLGTFESGTFVTLHASTASGHEFTGWSGACTGTATPCTVTLAGARYVAAHFRLVAPMVTSFYHVDTLGSVRAVTNATGVETRRDDYHAFGEAGTPPQGDSIRFTGKERDAETALDYFGARYYRNLMGRFTTVDPLLDVNSALAEPQRWNRYGYALNRPLLFVDPDGRNPVLYWLAHAAQRLAASPAAQRAQKVVAEQGARVWNALTKLVNTPEGQELVGTGAELATGGNLGPSFGHGARHLQGLKVTPASVEAAIVAQVQDMAKNSKIAGSFWGHVIIDGVTIRYRAFVLEDGSVFVGTYYPLD